LPFKHIDHLHPDWGIALAAAANGHEKLKEFNTRFGHRIIWVPWQRPGFELAMMLRRAVAANPGCDGIVLGGHGLFTWGDTQRDCYVNTLTVIDQLGEFVQGHLDRHGEKLFGGERHRTRADRSDVAAAIFPRVRGEVSRTRRMIGSFSDRPEVMRFVNSRDAAHLARLGTSCPDHFIRTKIRPLLVDWDPQRPVEELHTAIAGAMSSYRREYAEYYRSFAASDSPAMRSPDPTVVLVPGVGMFSFGKNKTEARITGEFYVNAIHVMEGASSLQSGDPP